MLGPAKQKKHVKHSKQSRKKQAKRKVVKKATVRKATLAQQALTCMVVNPNPSAVMCLSTAGGTYLFRHAGRIVAGAEVWDDRLGLTSRRCSRSSTPATYGDQRRGALRLSSLPSRP